VSPHDGATPEDLTRHADAAMYKAKESGSGYVVARRDNLQGWHGRLALLSDVAGALAEDQFVVHYQPIIRVRDDALIGVEALVRWEHPDHGLVMPGDFITLTESTDLIGPFTLMVLDKALGQLQEWRDEGHDISLSVNLAVANLLDVTLPAEVARLLSVHDVPADRLVLEITENTMMADPTRARGIIETLATMGVRIAIDDFGTGFSSLVHLKHLPVSIVKIDRSFVTGMLGDHDDATIVRSIVDLAANLGLQVTAEGVEHVDVYRALEGLDCTFAQGYLFSKPTTAADLRSWMRGHEAMRSLATRREDPRSTGEVLPFGTRSATPGPAVPAGGGEAIAR
jgi:EAL domain-containing protein (putative c-di-GMP-specific phosphodiesterase class I)